MQVTRQLKLVAATCVFVVAVVALASVGLGIGFERAVLLAPLLVVGVLVLIGLVLFWGKVAISQIRGTDQLDTSPFAQPGGKAPRPRDGDE